VTLAAVPAKDWDALAHLNIDTVWFMGPRAALWLACALLLTACATPQVARLPKVGAETACIWSLAPQDTVVGVSFSGGGSRAALFGAAGLEALGRLRAPEGGSVLEKVSYLSSVSGGGLPAAYYALHKPPRETPVLGPDGTMTDAYQTFFADLEGKVAQDFQSALIWRQISSFRFILNSALAATSLREIFEERLLGPGTFADLAAREKSGDSPRVMINSTLFNHGRRFLWTTLPPDATQYDFVADLDRSLTSRGITRAYPEVLNAAIAAYRKKNPPHVVQVFEVGTQSMVHSDAIVPVYRLMKQQQVALHWADFIETINGYYSKDNRLSSMPFNVSTPILYYNKDVFKRAGLGDTPPATWPDVEAASKKILAAGAATCGFTAAWPSWTMLENMFAWHDQPFASNQNGYTSLDTKLLINRDFGLMHVGALARWQKENIFRYGGRLRQADPKFINGECAMLVDTSAFIGLYGSSLKSEWGTGQVPHWGPPYSKANSVLGGASLWVLRGGQPADYKGVAQFLKFLTEPHQQMWWAATTGFVPITRTAVKSLEDAGFYKQNPEQWTAMSQLLNASPTPNSRGIRLGNYTQLREAIESELENIFSGKKTAKQGLDAAVLRGNAILKEFSVILGHPWSCAPRGNLRRHDARRRIRDLGVQCNRSAGGESLSKPDSDKWDDAQSNLGGLMNQC